MHIACIHNDVNVGNIIIDEQYRLAGIIDFTDACIDDIWLDLRVRFNNDAELQTLITKAYCALKNIPLHPTKIWIYYIAAEFSRFVQSIENNNTEKLPVISQRIINGWQERLKF